MGGFDSYADETVGLGDLIDGYWGNDNHHRPVYRPDSYDVHDVHDVHYVHIAGFDHQRVADTPGGSNNDPNARSRPFVNEFERPERLDVVNQFNPDNLDNDHHNDDERPHHDHDVNDTNNRHHDNRHHNEVHRTEHDVGSVGTHDHHSC